MYSYKINFIALVVFVLKLGSSVNSYVLHEPTFEILNPRGIRISIPDDSSLQFFAFHGNVNKEIANTQQGDISGEVNEAKSGRWTVQSTTVNLRDGDIINYWIYVQADGSSYRKMNQTWTVVSKERETRFTRNDKNQISEPLLLLDENFNSLNNSIWARDIKMSLAPDYEFCVYHNENHELLVQIKNGILRITPLILEDYYGENATTYGRIQLNGCTSNVPGECMRQAASYNILPPVISARLTTRQSFNFQYGKIEIRAKFPEGDWLYPEMWLEPRYNTYGHGYASGRILLGLARGNENLINVTDRSIFDSRRLDFGLRVGQSTNIDEHIVSKILKSGGRWTKDFHIYTTIWTADGFVFLVDEQEVGRLDVGLNGWMKDNTSSVTEKSAPFDQEFYITLGIGVGGVRVFPDGSISSGYAKPWKNVGAKAMLKFWRSRNEWLPSWKREKGRKSAFEIDYIKVWSV